MEVEDLILKKQQLEETINNTVVNDLASSISSKILGEVPLKKN